MMILGPIIYSELRGISADILDRTAINDMDRLTPHIGELRRDDHISSELYDSLIDLTCSFDKTPYAFDRFFRSAPSHLYNFSRGRAFKSQWNIAFTAGKTSDLDTARIGIGFALHPDHSEGLEDYARFIQRVRSDPENFRKVFEPLGSFSEPDNWYGYLLNGSPEDQLEIRDWRFVGKELRWAQKGDREILTSCDQFAKEAVRIFDHIRNGGFAIN